MKKHLLKKLRLRAVMLVALLCAGFSGAWGQSNYSTDYTGNITLSTTDGASATSAKVIISNTEYNAIKAGTGSSYGKVRIVVPSGTKYLHLHAAGWNGETVSLKVTGYNNISNISLTSDSGISSNSPFTISSNANLSNFYKVITFPSALSDNTYLYFTATGDKRFVIWGVTAEEEVSLTPSDLALTYAPINLTFANPSADPQTIIYTTSSTGDITVSSSNYVTTSINTENKTITVTPTAATPSTQTITVSQAKNNTYAAGNVTFTVTVNKPSHVATFSINGETSTQNIEEGAAITFPTVSANIYGKTFVGWTTVPIDGETNEVPTTLVQSATMGTGNVTYYAVFANKTEGVITRDILDRSFTGVTTGTSYSTWSGKEGTSGAVYAGNSAGGNSSIQLRSTDNSGIIATTSGGKIKSITVEWNSNTTTDRTLWVFGKNSAYSNASQLYNNAKQGTKIGEIIKGTNNALEINGDYSFIGIRSKSGAMYLTKISIEWQAAPTYSAYCTTIPTTTFTIAEACYDGEGTNTKYYGTYSNSSAFIVPSEVTISTIYVEDGTLRVTDLTPGTVVPANTGVMVSSTSAGEKTIALTSATGTTLTNNMLKPTGNGITDADMTETEDYKYYYLTMNGSQIGFWWRAKNGAAFDFPVANKAYLAVPADQAQIKGFSFSDMVDGIKAVETTETENNAIYNLAGQRVSKMQKGIYVVNGKKILVK